MPGLEKDSLIRPSLSNQLFIIQGFNGMAGQSFRDAIEANSSQPAKRVQNGVVMNIL
jgi:hypothetical protein